MNVVLLESLSISKTSLDLYADKLIKAGHTFAAFEKTSDINLQIQEAKNADILMLANMPLLGEVIHQCPQLKMIDIAFTGVDHVDLGAAKEKGITVCNASGYSTDSVAEWTLCTMLSLLRNIDKVQERCRDSKTKDGLVGKELRGKTVGFVGTGAIGRRTAELCRAFGCITLGYKGFSNKEDNELFQYLELEELFQKSDIISLHCPLTAQSRGLINSKTISYMKLGSLLVNAARGPVVDSQALADALNNGYLSGAAIDVFEQEPPVAANHPLLKAKNVIATPHIAFATMESMEKRARIVFDNIDKWLNNQAVNIVL